MMRTDLHALLGTRWALPVLDLLLSGPPARFGAIKRAIPVVSQRMLAKSLRALIAAGLAAQEGAFYGITELGARALGWSRRPIQGFDAPLTTPTATQQAE